MAQWKTNFSLYVSITECCSRVVFVWELPSNLFIYARICDHFLIIISHVASVISFFQPIHSEKEVKTRENKIHFVFMCGAYTLGYNKGLKFLISVLLSQLILMRTRKIRRSPFHALTLQRECETKCWIFVVYTCFDFPCEETFFFVKALSGVLEISSEKICSTFFALICNICTMHFKEMSTKLCSPLSFWHEVI